MTLGLNHFLGPRYFALRYFGARYFGIPIQTPDARVVEVQPRIRLVQAEAPAEEAEAASRVVYVGLRNRVAIADERRSYWSTR